MDEIEIEVTTSTRSAKPGDHLKYHLGDEIDNEISAHPESAAHVRQFHWKENRKPVIHFFAQGLIARIFNNKLQVKSEQHLLNAVELQQVTEEVKEHVHARYQKISQGSNCYSSSDIMHELLCAFGDRGHAITASA